MNLRALINKVVFSIQDDSFSEDVIIDLLNDAALIMASATRLPSLSIGYSTVTTDTTTHQVDMPSDYHRLLFRCMDGSAEISLRNNFEELAMIYGGVLSNSGDIVDVIVQGNTLLYQPIPTTETTLTLFYSKLPSILVGDTDTPTFLPSVKYHKVLAYYAISEIWDDIEDGLEGEKVNTVAQRAKFESGVVDMVNEVRGTKAKVQKKTTRRVI